MENFLHPMFNKGSSGQFKPVVTLAVCFVCIILFAGINLEGNLDNWAVYKRWGAPSSADLFSGSYWGLLTSNFLHTAIWHIAFNLYWFWIFGTKIEFESNRFFYLFLIITAGLVSSFAQLGFSDSTGIGLSGIGYALFGFLFVKSKTSARYIGYLDKGTTNMFLIWLVVCVVLTETNMMQIGNAAHIAGLVWGMAVAYVARFHMALRLAMCSVLFMAIASSFIWNPWATSWLSFQALRLHENKQYEEAIGLYQEILTRDADHEFASVNLKLLEIAQLSEAAYDYHAASDFEKARATYHEILALDPENEWAKENLAMLPKE